MKRISHAFKALGIIAIFLQVSPVWSATNFSERKEVQTFINEMVKEHQFDRTYLTNLFSQYKTSNEVIKHISKPFESTTWDKYRRHFLNPKRISGGVTFWKENQGLLEQASQRYQVPVEMIVAIIGVESFYGHYAGKYPIMEALSTLSFDYPPRSKFFKSELEHYLLMTREQKLDPTQLKGSYAGAMGMPQFIPSSYRHYGVDFDKSGSIDLINNLSHAIGSVAHYFKAHGWQPNQPVLHKAKVSGQGYKKLQTADKRNPKPTLSLAQLKAAGVESVDKITDMKAPVAFLEIDTGKEKQYWLGHKNFYVITRYNRSTNYAMAVYELSQEIAKAYRG